MEFIFTDIPERFFKAEVSEIKEENGAYGPYLRLIFTIIERGELTHYRFSGIVKQSSLKQSKFYRWITNILGQQPDFKISIQDIIGRECFVCLAKKNNYYSVTDVSTNPDQ
jgi:hypothetical protein